MSHDEDKYWYNLKTGEVEHGPQSLGIDRAGPFDTAEEAARAPEIIEQRSRAWAEEDAKDWKDGGDTAAH
ncbi:SPOR domain-containing protein [Microbacterium sp.]|uniref:SPOR domain-containing protein n=1 Tax=Microbacterium sp. TaxID=51671 RepID=UPI0037C8A0F2